MRRVLPSPMYRDRRTSPMRLPSPKGYPIVPSTPARRAYCALKTSVCCRCRAAWSASYWSWSCTCSPRGAVGEFTHRARTGHAAHVAFANRMWTAV